MPLTADQAKLDSTADLPCFSLPSSSFLARLHRRSTLFISTHVKQTTTRRVTHRAILPPPRNLASAASRSNTQLCLKHPVVRAKLGLPDKAAPTIAANSGENFPAQLTISDSPTKKRKISVQNLSPKELLALSVQLLSNGKRERAVPLLQLELEQDTDYLRALPVMGQTLLQNGQLEEATEYFEHAISKWAGVACIRQGKCAKGIIHLERVASLKEPDDQKSKAHYFDGLVLLASALYNEGRKTEAANYLRYAAAYNPAYKEYLEQCENDEDVIVSDLVSSRRGDY